MRPDDYLEQSADLYRYKHTIYGDNYRIIGKVMSTMFPDGITLKSEDDWNRIHLFLLSMVKKTRYANNYNLGGHEDSVADDIVYMAILQEIDGECVNKMAKDILTATEPSGAANAKA